MKRNVGRLSLLACVFAASATAQHAQAQPGSARQAFRRISTEDGLSQSTVICMLQDRRGYVWLGTEDGLNRYDGFSFVTYRNDLDDPNSLSNSYIWSLHEGRDGLLWIGTWGGGLNCFDPIKNTFTRYQPDPADSTSISHDRVTAIAEDSLGFLWVCTAGGGVNRFETATHRFTRMPGIASPPPANRPLDVFCMLTDHHGILWIGTYYSGLLRFDPQNGELATFRHDPSDARSISSDRITALCEAADGNIWVATWGGGLNFFHRSNRSFEHFRHDPRDSLSLPGDILRALMLDRRGRLWIGTVGAGLARFDSSTGHFVRYRHSRSVSSSLSDDVVCSVLEDAGGVLWFGTSNGVSLISSYVEKFPHFADNLGNPNGLNGSRIFAMCRDSLGFIWIGTEDAGLNQFDPPSGSFRHFRHRASDPSTLPNDYVTALMTDSRGEVWVGTYGGGIARFDRMRNSFRRFIVDRAHPRRPLNPWISALGEDRDGNIWVGTWVEGLFVMDRSGAVLRRCTYDKFDAASLPDNDVRCIARDHAGSMWIGTARGGVARIDSAGGVFQRFRHDAGKSRSISNDYVQSVYEDRRGNIWIGTFGGGCGRMNRAMSDWTSFLVRDGLASNVVYGILQDRAGRLWMSTNSGISCFDPDSMTFRNYSRFDGLQADEFNFGAWCEGSEGTMYFGGVNGFNVIDPDRIVHNPHIPPLVITGLSVFASPVRLDSALAAGGEIVLGHTQNFFTVEYAALDYSLPARNAYAYKLEGLDKSWVDAGTRRLASYTDVAPGRYVFHVRGTNNDGLWSEAGASLVIVIMPPFWQTWWFRVLGLAMLLAAGTLAYRLRVAALLRVERMRLGIASDLHDDIGSSLASIAVLADLVRNRMAVSPAASAHLLDISSAARTTSEALRDIVWFINPERDFTSDIIDHLQTTAAKLLAGVEHTFRREDQGPSTRLPMAFRRDVLLLYKEILGNIVRHAEAKHVEICVGVHGGRLRLTVADDGKGFDPSCPPPGNGLTTMRRRANQLAGNLDIRSEMHKGTTISLDAKIP
ncbi:MAG TPA: two-component regulator propeller domain-containing protein [Bacteroidota bacterium]|nr:two-component regulator propeller domain-containing protein [Bacteroidota bacterium]